MSLLYSSENVDGIKAEIRSYESGQTGWQVEAQNFYVGGTTSGFRSFTRALNKVKKFTERAIIEGYGRAKEIK